jgi:outer membrane protein TolC
VLAQPDNQRWTLKQCLERTLEASPDVHEAVADIQIAEIRLAQAKAGRLPQMTITGLSGIVNGADGEGFEARTENSDLGPFFKVELTSLEYGSIIGFVGDD